MNEKSLYFSHDYTASEDVKMLYLRQSLGMEGIGCYWFIIERLAQAGGYLPLKIIPVLSMQMQVTEVKVQGVVNNFNLFKVEDEQFYSKRLITTIEFRKMLQDSGAKGAAKRWGTTSQPKLKFD